MFAVSAIRTNQGTARIIAQRNAERIQRERIAREAEAKAKAEAERSQAEKMEAAAKSIAVISSFRVVDIILSDRASVKEIISYAVKDTRYTVQDILGHRRMYEIIPIRHYAILCAWAFRPDLSTTLIGKHMGGRDHSTIIHAKSRFGFDSRDEAARFIKQHGRDATLARLVKQAA